MTFIQLVSSRMQVGVSCFWGLMREGEYNLCAICVGEDVDVCMDHVGQRDHVCFEQDEAEQ